ncbi:MAG: ABC transporter permease [Acidobacteria bacterium]|nr:ABC transporter permease [Acidobacteriota bacterium]
MPYELFLALRYLRGARGARGGSARVTALAAVLGIACGVAALVVATALAGGFRDEMRDKILGGTAHATVARADGERITDWRAPAARLRRVEGVTDAAPTSYDGALLEGADAAAYAVLRAVDASSQRDLAGIRRTLAAGAVEDLFKDVPRDDSARDATAQTRQRAREDHRGGVTGESSRGADDAEATVPVVIGAELAKRAGLVAVGDEGWLVVGEKTDEPPGFATRSRRVRVVGTVRTGLFEYDSTWVYLSLAHEAEIEGAGEADSAPVLSVETADIYRTPEVAARVRRELGAEFTVVDWQEANRPLFAALALERKTVSLVVALIIAVAALNITTSLVLVVVERRADIAILGALGARARGVTLVFMIEGAIIGALGSLCGVALGVAACFVGDRYRLVRLPADVYSLAFVPLHPRAGETALAALVAFLICLAATVYPARRAASLRVADALRYE